MPDDSKAKKILKGILDSGFEAVKDSAKQLADTVAPGALLEQALGVKQAKPDELSQFLKNSGPNLTSEELEKRKAQLSGQDNQELEAARSMLRAAIPDHMRPPPGRKALTPYETTIQDEERKKAMAVEMQKKQAAQAGAAPSGKQARGSLFAKKKRPQSNVFEQSKNIKSG